MATYGIDLGTTYSCVAHIDDVGRPAIAKNAIGEDTTPSVVFFETPDNVVVGRDAKSSAKISPNLVVSLIKREMGNQVSLTFHGQEHTPESISAFILRELARAAAEHTGEPVKDVVITVPAYFGVTQREATRNAGVIAGLNVIDIVPEPVAAALHYQALNTGEDKTILVYDLGGGTFDTTVIRLSGSEVRVVCTDGDHHLGGADWDEKVANHLLDAFVAEHPDADAGDNEDFLQGLANDAESLKKTLSSTVSRRHNMQFAGEATTVTLTRDEFEQATAELLERTFEITARTIELARSKGVHGFDEVLLVGGASRMPAVAAGLRQRFDFEPRMHDPDLAVAKGAAMFGLIQSVKIALPDGDDDAPAGDLAVAAVADQLGLAPEQVRRLADQQVVTVSPRAFGVRTRKQPSDDEFIDHLINANDPLPATPPTKQYYTRYDGQVAIRIEVWEQAGAVASESLHDNEKIGEGLITGLPPLPRNSPLDVSFRMERNGSLRVHAVELSTRKDLTIELEIEGLSGEQVEQARDAVARYTVGG
ncbi:molecular chaperone DnaK (HSP70) [Saccharothrix tamanrassetensis]|uniref:Molecular chaperone DnaK (HSP70) n=1 Tax=Saccharothrix tamanrassetensis TaxID=1051531 RepID=A0A841CRU4_9PSEU|nr:Hsp70 family protein [Saccharothrix tamanrassetensis]MBB5959593.1 molecular chaperone DnaK (HSP70) [Saccharothrix tamanrassetensis]